MSMFKNKKFNRRLVREKALQILYSNEMNEDGVRNLVEEDLKYISSDEDREFFETLIRKVIRNSNEFDKEIEKKVSNWEMSRIALTDRILLRMGICEMLYFPDIPPKVTINEYIEIAKEFSTAKSDKFINGILDNILITFKKEGRLSKKGRGLIEDTVSRKSK